MTTMNLIISHRLYAAAAWQLERPQRKTLRNAASPWPGTHDPSLDLAFELVLDSKPANPAGFHRARPCEAAR